MLLLLWLSDVQMRVGSAAVGQSLRARADVHPRMPGRGPGPFRFNMSESESKTYGYGVTMPDAWIPQHAHKKQSGE